MSEELENRISVIKTLPAETIEKLPAWVKKNIDTAHLIGANKQTIETSDGRYNLTNTINDLSGLNWTKSISSVINTRYSTKGAESYAYNIRRIHPTPKPPQLMKEVIEFFTKENEIVFDYFMGVGGSLLGASLCGRRGAGIDLNSNYINAYAQAAKELNLSVQPCICGDSNIILDSDEQIMKLLNNENAGMILIDPPYANMMTKPKTGGDKRVYGNNPTPFSEFESDLGNMSTTQFINSLKTIVEKSIKYLKKKGYLVVFCKDMQPKNKNTNLLHADIINALNGIPLLYYRGLKIWADQTVKLFPYGYPFDFVANQIHQYILIFRKH